jgi:hypothetical protein
MGLCYVPFCAPPRARTFRTQKGPVSLPVPAARQRHAFMDGARGSRGSKSHKAGPRLPEQNQAQRGAAVNRCRRPPRGRHIRREKRILFPIITRPCRRAAEPRQGRSRINSEAWRAALCRTAPCADQGAIGLCRGAEAPPPWHVPITIARTPAHRRLRRRNSRPQEWELARPADPFPHKQSSVSYRAKRCNAGVQFKGIDPSSPPSMMARGPGCPVRI